MARCFRRRRCLLHASTRDMPVAAQGAVAANVVTPAIATTRQCRRCYSTSLCACRFRLRRLSLRYAERFTPTLEARVRGAAQRAAQDAVRAREAACPPNNSRCTRCSRAQRGMRRHIQARNASERKARRAGVACVLRGRQAQQRGVVMRVQRAQAMSVCLRHRAWHGAGGVVH